MAAKGAERERQRQIYHQTSSSDKVFFPAEPKMDIFEKGRVLRVCAYCRVSTENDAQLSSFELQLAHYQQLMGTHPNWDLRKIYADEGISGTSLKKREDFNAMIAACQRGEYDLIVTKSVSRFARNLVDCISLVRMLKQQDPPVGVFFETDNLNTLSESSELMLSFLATFAQEESVKKSESMNWSLRQRFRNEQLLTPALLGYQRPKDAAGHYIPYGKLEIVESEAEIVKFIFQAFLAGKTPKEIASLLTDIKCPTKTGSTQWNEGSICYILRNERYCGQVLTWKTFTVDLYEHKRRKNRKDREQYLLSNHHEPIVSPETFAAAQTLLENHKHHVRGGLPTMQVIGGGVFRGYVPVNHHWTNDDPFSYYAASSSADGQAAPRRVQRSTFSAFDFRGYQVVRGQFLTSRTECPILTIGCNRISFNVQCMRKFWNVPYIQLLLHPVERKIAIRPCQENSLYSIRWRPDGGRPLTQKTLRYLHFGSALFQIMEWNPDYLYRIQGTWVARDSDQIIVFNLSNAVPAAFMEQDSQADASPAKYRRVELCPAEWSNSFGEEFYAHAIQNSFYYLAPRGDWKAQMPSQAVPGMEQSFPLTGGELEESVTQLRKRVESTHGE